MDIHRVLIAVVLSLFILVIWSVLFPPAPPPQRAPSDDQPVERRADIERDQLDRAPVQDFVPREVQEFRAVEGRQIVVDTPLYRATFNSSGGILEHFLLKQFRLTLDPDSPSLDLITPRSLVKGPMGISWNRVPTWLEGEWSFEGDDLLIESGEEGSLTFVGRIGGIEIIRELTFLADTYEIIESIQVVNTTDAHVSGELANILATPSFADDRFNPTRVAYFDLDGLSHERDKHLREGLTIQNGLKWGGIGNHYFLLAFVPGTPGTHTLRADLENEIFRISVSDNIYIDPGQTRIMNNTYYIGPKDRRYLRDSPAELVRAIHYGWFNVIAKPLIISLNYFHGLTGNYGVAILLLTLVIKIVFWPLAQKSYKSMNQLKKLQPMMAKIREKYKDDRQKMNEEMMRLYKTYKVNPAGGCLPILIQIPVFIALYQGLMGAVELRHAPFIYYVPFTDIVWLADLSARDPFYVTPVIMGATMFLQQKMAPAPGDPLQAKIMMFLPLVFIFIFITFPSGLVLYWLANNVLSIGQQWWALRSYGNKPLVRAEPQDQPESESKSEPSVKQKEKTQKSSQVQKAGKKKKKK